MECLIILLGITLKIIIIISPLDCKTNYGYIIPNFRAHLTIVILTKTFLHDWEYHSSIPILKILFYLFYS